MHYSVFVLNIFSLDELTSFASEYCSRSSLTRWQNNNYSLFSFHVIDTQYLKIIDFYTESKTYDSLR